MNSLSGIKLISAATVFGIAAVVFTSIPFVLVIIRGIIKSKDRSTGGGDFMGLTLLAFLVHAVSTITFTATILVLDIVNKSQKSEHFFSGKIFKIFWAATGGGDAKGRVFRAAEVTATNSNEALGAYATLSTVAMIVKLLYSALPLVVIMGAIAYGASLATKDTYRQDYMSVIVYSGVSMVCAMLLYVAWAGIASQGLFLPHGDNLLSMIGKYWQEMLFLK